jgi:hypothetical protein
MSMLSQGGSATPCDVLQFQPPIPGQEGTAILLFHGPPPIRSSPPVVLHYSVKGGSITYVLTSWRELPPVGQGVSQRTQLAVSFTEP